VTLPFPRGGATAAALLLFALPLAAQDPGGELPAWLTGCWREASAGLVVEEVWLPPAGDAMFATGRTFRQDSLVGWEQLVLRKADSGFVLHARPHNQPPATFTAVLVSDTLVRFENPAHDFPQVIRYERRGADSLLATISGTVRERQRSVSFQYARFSCGLP
jgi:hypothetical protein